MGGHEEKKSDEGDGGNEGHEGHEEEKSDEGDGSNESHEGHEEEKSDEGRGSASNEGHEGHEKMKESKTLRGDQRPSTQKRINDTMYLEGHEGHESHEGFSHHEPAKICVRLSQIAAVLFLIFVMNDAQFRK